jgi:hypothetical protein
MSIKFTCSCGKRLRAREAMASRRSVCPRCGALVGIPSLAPPIRDAPAGPLTPAERFRTRRCVPKGGPLPAELLKPDPTPPPSAATSPTAQGADAIAQQPPERPKPPRRRQAETRWFHCLLYPFLAWSVVLGLAVILTVLTGLAALLFPQLLELRSLPGWHLALFATVLLVPLTAVGYSCASLECVLRDAADGRVPYVAWPGRDTGLVLASSLRWLTCFLAGPIFFAAGAALFWINCGEPKWIDRFIVGELIVLAVGYWLFALLSVTQSGIWPGLNPARVVEWIHRLGYRSAIVALVAAAVLFIHGAGALAALEEIHNGTGQGWLQGWLWLTGCWFSTLFWGFFLFRLLGVWCYQARSLHEAAGSQRQ